MTKRDVPWITHPFAVWEDPADDDEEHRVGRAFRRDIARFANGGVYLNFIGDEGQDRVRAAYGDEKYRASPRSRASGTRPTCSRQPEHQAGVGRRCGSSTIERSDEERLHFQELFESVGAVLSAEARLLVTAKSHTRETPTVVHTYLAGADLACDPLSAFSLPETAAKSPYTVSLAIATASSSVSYGMIERTGPKISSCAIVMSRVTFEKTVGRTK